MGARQRSQTEGLANDVGIEFAGAGNLAGHPAFDLDAGETEETADHALDEGVAVLEDEEFVNVVDEGADLLGGNRVLADGEDRVVAVGDVLPQIVFGETAGDDALFAGEDQLVVGARFRALEELGLFFGEVVVLDPGVGGQQGPLLDVARRIERVLLTGGLGLDPGAAVGDAGHEADHDRERELFRHVEGLEHHVVALLLVPRLEAGDESELGEVAAVLFVLSSSASPGRRRRRGRARRWCR